MLRVILYFSVLIANVANADVCEKWFLESGAIPTDKNCVLDCAIAPVNFATFACPERCHDLCQLSLEEYLLSRILYSPMVGPLELRLIRNDPANAYKIFRAMKEAEASTSRLFGERKHNNEADAFRHFVWSARSSQAAGEEAARKFLSAHENQPDLPDAETKMDNFNNERGFEAIREFKDASLSEIERKAIKALQEKKLNVLKPDGRIPSILNGDVEQ